MLKIRLAVFSILTGLLIVGCSGTPTRNQDTHTQASANANARAANVALRFIGKPYRYGGESPATGFDCSGLVQYSYGRAGVDVPRTTGEQWREGQPVARTQIKKGDLLFFNQEGKRSSHVAIYVGNDSFVHAPSSGKRVRRDRLRDPYWRKHFAGARRIN